MENMYKWVASSAVWLDSWLSVPCFFSLRPVIDQVYYQSVWHPPKRKGNSETSHARGSLSGCLPLAWVAQAWIYRFPLEIENIRYVMSSIITTFYSLASMIMVEWISRSPWILFITVLYFPKLYWGRIDQYNCIYLKCTVWWFHYICITKIKIINTSITSHSTLSLFLFCDENTQGLFLANVKYTIACFIIAF